MVVNEKEKPNTAPQTETKSAAAPDGSLEARVRALEAENAALRAAAQSPAPTKMVAPRANGKVKIRTVRAIRLGKGEDAKEIPEGVEVEVDEATAREFCDKVFKGPYDWAGERSDATATVHKIVRAVRVG